MPLIERWWELVFSAYLMVSLRTVSLQTLTSPLTPLDTSVVAHHPAWLPATGWKHTLNNLRLLIQPFIAFWILLPWLNVFVFPALDSNLQRLIASINAFT